MTEATPYRGEDTTWFQTFGQHVGIAEGCLEDLSPLAQRFAASVRFALDSTLLELCNQVGPAWESMWIQLDQARSVAARSGRDVSAYDAARKQVRNRSSAAISLVLSDYHPTRFPPGQQLAYRTKEALQVVLRTRGVTRTSGRGGPSVRRSGGRGPRGAQERDVCRTVAAHRARALDRSDHRGRRCWACDGYVAEPVKPLEHRSD